MKKFTLLLFLLSSFFSWAQFSENFDAGTNLPAGWSIINLGSANGWIVSTPDGAAHSGTNVAKLVFDSSVAHNDYLITPQISVTPGVNERFTFWARSRGTSGTLNEHFEVKLSVTGTAAADFTQTLQGDTEAPITWTKFTINLSSYAGQSVYVAFRAFSTNKWELYFDDIVNDSPPTTVPNCDATLTSPADGSDSAALNGILSWSAATGAADGYKISVGTTPNGTDVVNMVNVGNNTGYDIPGSLNANTIYYVKIIPYNAFGDAISCTEYSFTTGEATPGEFCSNAIDLGVLTSPLSGTTVGALNNNMTTCNNNTAQITNTHPDLYYSILVPNGSTLTIGQTVNNYDSSNVVFYGNCASNTVIACFNDADDKKITWSNTTGIDQTVYWIQDGNVGSGTFTLAWTLIGCMPPTVSFSTNSLCTESEQNFEVVTQVTSLGSATALTVYDDQGNTQNITMPGTVTFGPFAQNTPVTVTVENADNSDCTITSSALTQTVCAPINDNCSGAIALTANPGTTCTTVTPGKTTGATASPQADDITGTPNNDVWFSFTATSAIHKIAITNVAGTLIDMGMGIYSSSGNCAALTYFADSDPDTLTLYYLTIGGTYYVRVYNWSATISNNTFNICLTTLPAPPPPPVNDNCSGAIALTVNTNFACGTVTAGTTAGAMASPQPDDLVGTPNNDVWFSFVATSAQHRVVLSNVVGELTDMAMGVYSSSGSCAALTFFADSDPNTLDLTGLTIGTTYYVRVYNWSSTISFNTFNICIGTPPPPPANDNCTGAIALTVNADLACGTVTAGTTTGATASSQPATSLAGTPNNDVWFSFTATNAKHRVSLLNVIGTLTDMAMGVYSSSGSCAALTFFATSDPNTLDLTGLTIGAIYYVRVYNFSSTISDNNFNICIGTTPLPPVNDDCSGAIALTVNADLTCGTVTAGTTAGATASPQPDDVVGTPNNDVWFSFTATNTQHRVSLSNVVGDNTDMAMGVYSSSGSCAALTFFADSDPNNLNLTGLTIGITYYVRVYNWSATISHNTFNICIGTPPPPPANDDCSGAIALTINADVACGTVTAGTTTGATASPQPDDVVGTPNNDVWFSFTATNVKHTVSLLNVVGDLVDMAMGVYSSSGSCAALTFFATSDPNTLELTGLTIGTTYYVRVYNSSAAIGYNNFNICVGTLPLPPANDDCSGAIALTVNADLTCGTVTAGTTASATASSQPDDVVGTPNNDVWFSFVATHTQHYISLLNVVGDNTDMAMGVYSSLGSCAALTFFTDSDPNGLTLNGLIIGTTYYVRVYNWSSTISHNNFNICVGSPSSPPANDDCSGAIALTVNADFACGTVTAGTTAGATASAQPATSLSGTPNNDVWFSFTATQVQHRVSLLNVVGAAVDMGMGVYSSSGSCAALTFFSTSDPDTLNLTGLTIGTTYYVRVYNWSSTISHNNFNICIGTPPGLGIDTPDVSNFIAYPNPVKDILNISYAKNISNVAVVNLLGQEVITKRINANVGQIDMSHLASGTYIVRVTVDDMIKTIKVIKK